MSLDGKIATSKGDSRFSSREDLKRVHKLRASVDGIMIGLGTLLADDPHLTANLVRGSNPTRIIVDSNARTPLNANVVKTASQIPTIIAVTSRAQKAKVRALERAGVTVMSCGNGRRVSLPRLLRRLRTMGVMSILLEGGGTLNWSMFSLGLVDEVSVAISPRIVGGATSITLVEGRGVAATGDAIRVKPVSVRKFGTDTVLRYRVLG